MMGNVLRFDANHRHVAPALPVALAEAWAAYCFECQAAWVRWLFTGR